MDRKTPQIRKLDSKSRGDLAGTLRDLPRPKLSRPFGHRATQQGDSRLAARLEKLLGLSQKERRDAGMRLAKAALSTLNLLIGSEQIELSKKQAKRSVGQASAHLSPPVTTWMLRTFLAFLRTAGPETLITQVAFRSPKRKSRHGRDDSHPLPKESFDGEKRTTLYASGDFYRRDGVARLYK